MTTQSRFFDKTHSFQSVDLGTGNCIVLLLKWYTMDTTERRCRLYEMGLGSIGSFLSVTPPHCLSIVRPMKSLPFELTVLHSGTCYLMKWCCIALFNRGSFVNLIAIHQNISLQLLTNDSPLTVWSTLHIWLQESTSRRTAEKERTWWVSSKAEIIYKKMLMMRWHWNLMYLLGILVRLSRD